MEMNNYIIDFNNKKESIISYNNEEWKLLNCSTITSKYYISNFGRVKSITNKGIRIMKTQLANGYERTHILNIFDSLQAAANCLNVGKTAIHNVIKGYSKYCRGYKFYYN